MSCCCVCWSCCYLATAFLFFFFSSRRRHTRSDRDWSSDVCSSDLEVPITPQNRITLVQNGTIDLECSSTTNNLDRQKQVAFSNTIFIIGTRLLTRKDSGIKEFSDLKGKNVVTTAGTTSERILRNMNDNDNMGINIISTKEHGQSFLTLESGRAVAFMMDDALLFGERAKSKQPEDWLVVGKA